MVLKWVRTVSQILIVVLIFSTSGIYTACKREGDQPPPNILPTPPTAAATFTQVYSIFNQAGCLASNCHASSNVPVMNSQSAAYSNLVGKTSNCRGKIYVVPSHVSSSYLIEKIAGTPACGVRMPQNNIAYFDSNSSQLETIKNWISNGAKNN